MTPEPASEEVTVVPEAGEAVDVVDVVEERDADTTDDHLSDGDLEDLFGAAVVRGAADAFRGEDTAPDEQGLAMWEDDASEMYPEQRRCLHALLKNRYISAERHPEHWAVLMSNFPLIKSRLNDLFLELEVNRSYQVAFKRQASTDTGDSLPSLLRDLSHTKEETIVMMFLRRRFFTQQQEGEDYVFVDRVSMLEEVADMRPEQNTHRAMDRKRAEKAIDSLTAAGILLKTPDPDRFRISPIIEVLLPIERQRALWAWLMNQNATDGVPDDRNDDRDYALDELAIDDDPEEQVPA